jgi:prepilin-type N-terminal cleavage/methylation domain-containing protein
MKTKNLQPIAGKSSAFSLVEMLVVISILLIITAIAVPMVANATTKAGGSRDHRNAQTIATMANNAIASGNLTLPNATGVEEIVDQLVAGVDGSGVFEGTKFQVNSLSDGDRAGAIALLNWTGGILEYQPN